MKRHIFLALGLITGSFAFSACGEDAADDPAPHVSCDDGLFCNGVERVTADGSCASPGPACDDGADCTLDECDEATQRCAHEPSGDCASCSRDDCTSDCSGKECGDDGCGESCGTCDDPSTVCASIQGLCVPRDTPGTCENPLPLLPDGTALSGRFTVDGDTTDGAAEVIPTCNSTSTSVELVYAFDVTENTGIDFRSEGFDTVLHLRMDDPITPETECLDDDPAATIACSDDSAPPSDSGSRITALLEPGKYYLIVDGFDSDEWGEFELSLTFDPGNCSPQCDGRYCGGDDGCGGDCGACPDGETCAKGSCIPDPCTPECDGRECGSDGCGGECGTCPDGLHCLLPTGTCEAFPVCDHDAPTCDGCADDEFCGTDCLCHPGEAPLPDLVVNEARLESDIRFETRDFNEESCAIQESCVDAVGTRKLLRFSVEAVNQGQESIVMPPAETRPDLFEWSSCHRHFHHRGFAVYELLDGDGNVVLTGRKQAFCMIDSEQVFEGPTVDCQKDFTCNEQGISPGWSDVYGNSLDCQWLDVTDIPPGNYQLRVRLNPEHNLQEMSFDNNAGIVPVTIE